MLWVLRTGTPRRDLPERYGPWRTIVLAYQQAAGAKKGIPGAKRSGAARGVSMKGHIRAEGAGQLLTLVLAPGRRRGEAWWPWSAETGPYPLVRDGTSPNSQLRQYIRRYGILAPCRANPVEHRTGSFDRSSHCERRKIEN
jgi:hypothetical protein